MLVIRSFNAPKIGLEKQKGNAVNKVCAYMRKIKPHSQEVKSKLLSPVHSLRPHRLYI